MRHHHRLFAGLLIVLYSLFTASSLVAFGFEEGGTGSNSCNAQAADSGYANLPPYSKDATDSTTSSTAQVPDDDYANVTDAGWWVGYPGTGEPDSGYANLPPYSKDPTVSATTSTAQAAGSGDADVPPYMEHIVVDSPTDGYANLPPSSKDASSSAGNAVSTEVTSSDYLARQSESSVTAASTEVAEIYVPIAVAPAAYAAHTELFAVAPDCQEILAPVPTWIAIEVEGQAPTSTVTATCSRCESTAF